MAHLIEPVDRRRAVIFHPKINIILIEKALEHIYALNRVVLG